MDLMINKLQTMTLEDRPKNYIMILDIETDGGNSIIQIAYNIYDKELDVIKKKDFLINEGHGKIDYYKRITLEEIVKDGHHPKNMLPILQADFDKCKYIIGHNIDFDLRHISRYFLKYRLPCRLPTRLDTMRVSRNLVGAKDKRGRVKNPRLGELYQYFFGTAPSEDSCHRADYDTEITHKCSVMLVKCGLFSFDL